MSNKDNQNKKHATKIVREDVLANPSELIAKDIPPGVDRRTFLMRSAVVGAAVLITGNELSAKEMVARSTPPARALPLWSKGYVEAKEEVIKGPVMTVIDEFYKVGPGPSSSHTIGPMRITYDFYQRD
jgi:L-serine dehydratase